MKGENLSKQELQLCTAQSDTDSFKTTFSDKIFNFKLIINHLSIVNFQLLTGILA